MNGNTNSLVKNLRNYISIAAIIFSLGMIYSTLYSHINNKSIHLNKGDAVFSEKEKIELLVAIKTLTGEVKSLKVEVRSLRLEVLQYNSKRVTRRE